ncbi:MAG: mevalonate kinase [Candidatus Lokiarchaeota archaeon]|nr:mevalonate kinase [Candidatus Lokiarchaeota archaeon]
MEKDLERPYFLAKFSSHLGSKRNHFVVYGLPAIASALGNSTIAKIKVVEGKGWEVDDQRPATPGYKKKKYDEAMHSIKNVLEYLNIDTETQKLEIYFAGDLFAASGVGASAAQCTSLARALNDTFNLNLDAEKINEAAYEGERAYHGTPSGIDNTVSTYGGLIWFVKNLSGGKNTMDLLKSLKKIPLVIGNTRLTASTTEVVADVKKLKESAPQKFEKIFKDYEIIAKEAKNALLSGNVEKIGILMNQNHKLLQQITVSGELNDKIVETALKNGALGAKMTGTGRGGLVIAITENENAQEKVAKAIEKEGFDAWRTMIG